MPVQRVAIIGPCASGKSSVAAGLRKCGIDAWPVGQEHSQVADLWRHQNPSLVVYLEVSLETLRARRQNPDWPEWIYQMQIERLRAGRTAADIVFNTNGVELAHVICRISSAIDECSSSS